MDGAAIAARLEQLVGTGSFADGEIEECVELLAPLPGSAQQRALDLVPSLWPVSHALTFSFLRHAALGLAVFGEARLQVWVAAILDAYEAGGLERARPLIADGGRGVLGEMLGENGVRYRDVAGLLHRYLNALGGGTLEVAEGHEAATDTVVVWLPRRVAVFDDAARNRLLFKLAAAVQWGHIAAGTYRAELPPDHPLLAGLADRFGTTWAGAPAWLESYFGLFADPGLAQRLYFAAATLRAATLVASELPGLARAAAPVLGDCFALRADPATLLGRERFFEELRRWSWNLQDAPHGIDPAVLARLAPLRCADATAIDALLSVAGVYHLVATLPAAATAEPPPFEGAFRPALAAARRSAPPEAVRKEFVAAVRVLVEPGAIGKREHEMPGDSGLFGHGGALRQDEGEAHSRGQPGHLVEEVRHDCGRIPAPYVTAAIARTGTPARGLSGVAGPDVPRADGPFVYDEWDFRRAGFRRDWCAVHRLELAPGDPAYVAATLRRYRGPLRQIRRAFELMRPGERFARRQSDGDEVDIDATVEAHVDLRAGLPASERLYTRLVRDTRDIAVVFLVDMSSSTEGWVNAAIRESLVLLSAALEVLGDRWGAHGFSGMKRLRSEVYRIKDLDEPCGDAVRGRIAAVDARDYTRMGPPIRHATRLLRTVDAKTRLLVILSDGKPEDCDEYRGDYAVEDTRHALLEARIAGVRPFCITLDPQAHDYVEHLFGEIGYAVIDDVAKLPLRVPEIYRALTA